MFACYSAASSFTTSLGILPMRLVMGAAFILHGLPKIQNLTTWMGTDSGISGPLQAAAAIAEFGGGIALVLGLLTRLASVGIIGVMIGALMLVHIPQGDPFVAKSGSPSCELAAVYLSCAFLFLMVGAGRFSADALLLRRRAAATY